jgi:DNA replication protein DnaC
MANRECPQCEGTGWKPVEADGVRRMAPCDCQAADRAERRLLRARIKPRYKDCAFENFDVRKDRQTGLPNRSLEAAKLFAQKFVEEYPTDFGLLFVGTTGVGKTHLAVAVLRELIIRKGVEGLFYDFHDLLKEIRDSWDPNTQTSELRVLQPVLDAEVLLLDELAAVNPSDWVKETLRYIINSRYNHKKVTLITTTLPFGESTSRPEVLTPTREKLPDFERSLNLFGGTFRSRLYEMCKVVEMHSDDYRKAIKQAGLRFHAD